MKIFCSWFNFCILKPLNFLIKKISRVFDFEFLIKKIKFLVILSRKTSNKKKKFNNVFLKKRDQ